jgi:hypothetical protein
MHSAATCHHSGSGAVLVAFACTLVHIQQSADTRAAEVQVQQHMVGGPLYTYVHMLGAWRHAW